ncbi:MAG: gluconolactonase [Pseudonocardiaceae bacterium]|nr:gluconolactonase [Pseudonocardiaceae bacterium]
MGDSDLDVVASGFSFLEGPRWHDGRLWVSDFYTHRVVAVSAQGEVETVAEVPQQPSGLGWLPDGRMLAVSMRDRRLLRREDSGRLVEHADLSQLASWHLNDMVVDAAGRAYVGNFGFDLMGGAPMRPANIVRVDPDSTATVVAEDMLFPNGMAITPDGATLIAAESFGQRLTAFDVDGDGSLRNRREWARFGAVPETDDLNEALAGITLVPDGMCLDTEGAVWVADAIGHRVVRVRDGEIVDEVSAGDLGVFACMLGGDDGRTLFLCTAPSFAEHERRDTREAVLLSATVQVPHAGLP